MKRDWKRRPDFERFVFRFGVRTVADVLGVERQSVYRYLQGRTPERAQRQVIESWVKRMAR